jgi:hypothetical protein
LITKDITLEGFASEEYCCCKKEKKKTNMSAKAVREYHGKKLIAKEVKKVSEGKHVIDDRSVLITPDTDLEALPLSETWLTSTELVVKPDQLIKRRGKAGLVGIKLGT